jgi:hypothetical protein
MTLEDFMKQYHDAQTTKLIKRLVKSVLENNLIEFNGRLYLQLIGCAIGTQMAPNYANLFMHYFKTIFTTGTCSTFPVENVHR